MRRPLSIALGLVLLLTAFGLGYALSSKRHAAQPTTVELVREELASRYYRDVPATVLRQASIERMLNELRDPYTEYLDARGYRLLRQETAASYSGIGVTLLPSKGGFLVVSTQPGPGERAGIRVGDTITRIGETPTKELGLASALTRIVGRPGTSVRLEIVRGAKRLTFDVPRGEIRAPTVSARLVAFGGQRYGYARLESFRTGAAQLLGDEVRRLERSGATGLVLDLRENPGGLLEQAVAVSSLFLAKGNVVTLRGRHQPAKTYTSRGRPETSLPLVVLVDRYTASSAEVVAAALQDNGRATLVGEHTFGKAVVQTVEPLGNGDALLLTTARYYTPRGADISRAGVRPDIAVVDEPQTRMDEVLATGLAALAAAR